MRTIKLDFGHSLLRRLRFPLWGECKQWSSDLELFFQFRDGVAGVTDSPLASKERSAASARKAPAIGAWGCWWYGEGLRSIAVPACATFSPIHITNPPAPGSVLVLVTITRSRKRGLQHLKAALYTSSTRKQLLSLKLCPSSTLHRSAWPRRCSRLWVCNYGQDSVLSRLIRY